MRCRHSRFANAWACRSMARHTGSRRGAGWFWLIVVAFVFLPWSWACDRRVNSVSARGPKFQLEVKTENTEKAIAQAKTILEEMKQRAEITDAKFNEEMRKLDDQLRGAAESLQTKVESELAALASVAETSREVKAKVNGDAAKTGNRSGPTRQSAQPARRETGRATSSAKGTGGSDSATHWTIELELSECKDDPERAKAAVVDQACERIAQWIREQRQPDLSLSTFKPDEAYLKKWSMIKHGPESIQRNLVDSADRIWGASIEIELRPDVQLELIESGKRSQEDFRLEQAWDRQLIGTKALAAVGALLIAVLAYFHLDDRTRGYYSKPLGAALIGGAIAFSVAIFKA